MALLRFAATVGAYTLASRVLGFLRDILIASFLGASAGGDAFFVAFKLPNLFRRLFAEGAFNLAFVPLFAGKLRRQGRAAAKAFAADSLAVLLWTLLVLVALAQLFMPWVMIVFAPGFMGDAAKFDLTVHLSRLTFPYLLFLSLAALLGGLLNSLDKFAAAAATPILLNLCLIGALLGFGGWAETPAHALAWGVAVAGAAQFLWLAWHCHRVGMLPPLPVPRLTPEVRRLLIVMAPAALGAGVQQINLVVDMIIASLLPGGSVSYLYYADRVVQLPLGVIGVAIGTVLLPTLARQVSGGETLAARDSQNRALEFALLLTLPAAAALIVIATPVIGVLFERGAFDPAATAASAGALAAYASGLPAFVLIKVLAPGYFARSDTRTPLKIAALCLVVNVALNLALMGPLAHVGIALASALSSWLNVALLAWGLHRRGHLMLDESLRRRVPRMVLAAAVMAVALIGLWPLVAPWLAATLALKIAALLILVAGGAALFAAAATLLGAARPSELATLLRR
ncbi:MAG: murein biosynthesis integral membrane protein MurJ [Alphaproteobacteria bacterium]|nr:murein biosynthesis integral membrane protein MurJ [Alphaproteobacteria bacterium]